jgi:type IV secretory pathway VirB10-like protein
MMLRQLSRVGSLGAAILVVAALMACKSGKKEETEITSQALAEKGVKAKQFRKTAKKSDKKPVAYKQTVTNTDKKKTKKKKKKKKGTSDDDGDEKTDSTTEDKTEETVVAKADDDEKVDDKDDDEKADDKDDDDADVEEGKKPGLLDPSLVGRQDERAGEDDGKRKRRRSTNAPAPPGAERK